LINVSAGFPKQKKIDEVYCSNCKEHLPTSKKMDIWRLPPILIIHLKRFQFYNNRWRKSMKRVEFPLDDLKPSRWLPKKKIISEEEKNISYELFGVVNHYGQLEGGHYTAYSKNPGNGNWYNYDDNRVSEDIKEIITPAAYLLFYKRKDLDKNNYLFALGDTDVTDDFENVKDDSGNENPQEPTNSEESPSRCKIM